MPFSVPASTLVAGGLEPDGEVAAMALPLQDTGFTVGFAGRLIDAKGWRVLVEALPNGANLALAGDGPQRAEVEALAAENERIRYLGLLPKDELWSFYAALDCLAVPSLTTPRWKEQSASTLVDGLAMGLPMVASDSGGIADIMGEAGLLVREGDADELRDALERVRDDPELRGRLSTAGRERFRQEFAIPAYASKIATALNLHVRSVALGA
jgi:glycosyltransferase involved in cell wall biosynthesis